MDGHYRDAFSQQAADSTKLAITIDWTICCDWLQVVSSCMILHTHIMVMRYAKVAGLVASFI